MCFGRFWFNTICRENGYYYLWLFVLNEYWIFLGELSEWVTHFSIIIHQWEFIPYFPTSNQVLDKFTILTRLSCNLSNYLISNYYETNDEPILIKHYSSIKLSSKLYQQLIMFIVPTAIKNIIPIHLQNYLQHPFSFLLRGCSSPLAKYTCVFAFHSVAQ